MNPRGRAPRTGGWGRVPAAAGTVPSVRMAWARRGPAPRASSGIAASVGCGCRTSHPEGQGPGNRRRGAFAVLGPLADPGDLRGPLAPRAATVVRQSATAAVAPFTAAWSVSAGRALYRLRPLPGGINGPWPARQDRREPAPPIIRHRAGPSASGSAVRRCVRLCALHQASADAKPRSMRRRERTSAHRGTGLIRSPLFHRWLRSRPAGPADPAATPCFARGPRSACAATGHDADGRTTERAE